jgi:hypothetical protein
MDDATRRMLLDDPALFIVTYFADKIERLEPFHIRLIEQVTTKTRSLSLYPAGHGKSTLVSTLLPIWEVCKNPNVRIAIVAKNTTEGEGIIRAIQSEMVENEDLVRDFGPFRSTDEGKAWSLSRMDVAKRTRRGKSSTIAMFGASSKDVLGYRTDWTVCDDVVDDINSATPEARLKLRNWFDLRVETGPEHLSSRLSVVGTRFHPNDLYGDLLEIAVPDEKDRLTPMYSVYREDGDAIVDADNHVTLWPARWPWARLMQQKVKVGTLNFNKRYRNIAIDESRMVFKEEFVRGGYLGKTQYRGCLDKSYRVGDYGDNWRRVAGFDPASGASKHAKFCAHVVLASGSCKDHEKCYWVVDLERDQWTLPQQVDLILAKHQKYGLLASQVEANSYQAGLLEAIEQKMRERDLALRIQPHYTSKTSKPDPELGVQAMSPWVERGAFHIPWGDAYSQRRMSQLVDEMVMYPDSRTTDTVMALWFAWRELEQAMPAFKTLNRLERDAPMWNRRIGRKIIKNPAYVVEAV